MTQLGLLEGSGDVQRDAAISTDGLYRYRLTRSWGEGKPVNFLMLNPSTADASVDDPTIRRCIGFAKQWGYPGLIVTNLFAFRATDPRGLFRTDEPTGGEENDEAILEAALESSIVVAAWGAHPKARERARLVVNMLRKQVGPVYCIATTVSGSPVHPLYQPREFKPRLYEGMP